MEINFYQALAHSINVGDMKTRNSTAAMLPSAMMPSPKQRKRDGIMTSVTGRGL